MIFGESVSTYPLLTGRVIFQYLYDVGGDIDSKRIPKDKLTLIDRPKQRGDRVLAPKYEEYGMTPLEVDLETKRIGRYRATIEGRIFPIGVIGIYISIDFRKISFDDLIKLVRLNEGKAKVEKEEVEFDDIPLKLFRKLRKIISDSIVYPYPSLEQPQIYTLILLTDSEPRLSAKDFLQRYKKQTAGLLRSEAEWRFLSQREVEDALKPYLSYSSDDIVIVDWYAALISGAVEYTDDLIRIIEFSLVQLLELKTYDRLLDLRISRAYSALRQVLKQPPVRLWIGSKQYRELSKTIGEITEFRIEVMDLIEDARNITKLTGEWYLGKLYRLTSERFRISDWLTIVGEKLERLQQLYTMMMARVDVQRSNFLEVVMLLLILTIVILEIIMVAQGV